MIDWNGNGKIDPIDIGVSVATEEDKVKEENKKAETSNIAPCGCLTCFLPVIAFIILFFITI